jgi:hypothetical protein
MKFLLLCLLSAIVAPRAEAVLGVTNSFSGAISFAGQTNAPLLTTNISTLPANFTIQAQLEKVITVGGLASSASADRFMASQWSTNSFNSDKYFQLTLTATPAVGIPFANFDSIAVDFALRRSSSGPRQFQWRSSFDDFNTVITNFTLTNPSLSLSGGVLTLPDTASTETFGGNRLVLSAPALPKFTTITLRLYGYQAESALGQGGLDSPFELSGKVVVPEPSTYALLSLAAAVGLWLRIRRPKKL